MQSLRFINSFKTTMMELLVFQPIYQERVWGGRNLATTLGRSLPDGAPIGESWEIVDRPEACSRIARGAWEGQTLRQVLVERGPDVLGPKADPSQPFPILVKWLDCQERLSLQVHPPAEVAPELNGEPKTENWYIAGCQAGAQLIAGLKRGATREAFEQALRGEGLEDLCHRFPVVTGCSLLVRSGRIHAIDAGNLILEIQQNSDTTYRVYDWGRVGLDGKPRALHVEQSMRSIDFDDFEPEALPPAEENRTLADCAEFRIREFHLDPEDPPLELPAGEQPRLVHVVAGELEDELGAGPLVRGDNALQPFACGLRLRAKTKAIALITDNFLPAR
jgi:mannose-6-phosphate isomerase